MYRLATLSFLAAFTLATIIPTGTASAQNSEGELNLAEANVTSVSYSKSGGGGVLKFDVTLYHDDEGEEGYANWWQVESMDGEQLGRRELLHAHGTREFTRSETITVPEETRYVVVRGHDEVHDYGGRVAIVDLNSGAVEFVSQGPDPRNFTEYGETKQPNVEAYRNDRYGFKFSYPKPWTKTEIVYKGTGTVSVNAYPDPHRATVSASRLKQELALKDYVEALDLRLEALAKYQEVEKQTGTVSNSRAFIREYTMARPEGGRTRSKDVYLKKEGVIYELSFVTSAGSYKDIEEKYFDTILNSFAIISKSR